MFKNMIFIMGCGHSGTSLLLQLVGNHKNVYKIETESHVFCKTKVELTIITSWDQERSKQQKKWICEKSPSHVHRISNIYTYVENPKIIVIIRNGLDVVASLYKRNGNLDESMNRWINDNHAWMSHSEKHTFHVVKYEDLVKNPEESLSKICEFLGEEDDLQMINYPKSHFELDANFFETLIDVDSGKHEKLRRHQLNKNIYNGSNRYLNDFVNGEVDVLMRNEKFTEIMLKLNYELKHKSSPSICL
jgi:hypothetical protein